MTYADYEWYLKHDLSKYSGSWVAIANNRVIAADKDVGKVIDKSKNLFPKKTPFIAKINNRLTVY